MNHEHQSGNGGWLGSRRSLVLLGFLAIVALAPDAAATIGGYIVHMDLSKVGRAVTWRGAFVGFGFFTAFVALVCAASGGLSNRIAH